MDEDVKIAAIKMIIPESLLEARYQGVMHLTFDNMFREVRNYAQDKTHRVASSSRRSDGPTPMDIGAMIAAAAEKNDMPKENNEETQGKGNDPFKQLAENLETFAVWAKGKGKGKSSWGNGNSNGSWDGNKGKGSWNNNNNWGNWNSNKNNGNKNNWNKHGGKKGNLPSATP